jgi:hypothetical protein
MVVNNLINQTHTQQRKMWQISINSLWFDWVCNTIGDVGNGKKLLNKIEHLHHTLHFDLKRSSERDFPRGSTRNGVLKNTLVSATKHRGNMF